ncbi:hypothetical protein SCHPADRAFT_907684 [Schizopora paradoxa]|uniref:Zn(2)-C6 fungal-type domain-containing protein n=1 Tax=Schizopora paradoxa TaxID=27342 RepID=A0A0H2RDD3_9AGAM|nr:hypothetical protein SCHPADRAFT_907684 [Schizopora paradoxa]
MASELFQKSIRGKSKGEITELKRSKGIISCAECRRLKLKCDKQIPCSHCKRRGCPSICPHGEFSLGYGNKHVLADREKLQQKLHEMSSRIKQLEDTLRIAHGCHSSTSHPLLSDDLLLVKEVSEESLSTVNDVSVDDVLDALGTLSITDQRTERFLGGSSTAETLLIRKDEVDTLESKLRNLGGLPIGFTDWFFIDGSNKVVTGNSLNVRENEKVLIRAIEERLPPRERASTLCEAYMENLSIFMRPLDREQIYEELIPALYERDDQGHLTMRIDDLGLILAIFACGAIGDLTMEPLNNESAMYHRLSLSCLGVRPCISQEYVALATVQTTLLTGFYYLFTGLPHSSERAWKVKCLVCMLVKASGLHRDPSHWHFDEKVSERRRMVFWELYSTEQWQSLGTGRPPLIRADGIDCRLPKDTENAVDCNGRSTMSAWSFRQHFVKDVISVLSLKLSSTKSMKYSEVLELDKKIRDFDVSRPNDSNKPATAASTSTPAFEQAGDILRILMGGILKHFALLHVHRAFFAEAINRSPENPIQSPFGPSFLSAYRSAVAVLQILRSRFDDVSHLLFRLWPVWNFTMTSAVVVAVVVARCPANSLAPAALLELNLTVEMFEKSTVHPVIRNSLATITKMRNNARDAFFSHPSRTGNLCKPEDDRNDDVFDILRGRARTIQSEARRRERALSLDGRIQTSGAQIVNATQRDSSPASMHGVEVLSSKIYAMDDWHVQGTPSSDGVHSDSFDYAQQVGTAGQESGQNIGQYPSGYGFDTSGNHQMFVGDVGPQTFGSNALDSNPHQLPSSNDIPIGTNIENTFSQNPYALQQYLQGIDLLGYSDVPSVSTDGGSIPSGIQVGDESISSGADDIWKSLISGSGLLGTDDFDILDAPSLQ